MTLFCLINLYLGGFTIQSKHPRLYTFSLSLSSTGFFVSVATGKIILFARYVSYKEPTPNKVYISIISRTFIVQVAPAVIVQHKMDSKTLNR